MAVAVDLEAKISVANQVLEAFAPETSISRGKNGFYVSWKTWRDKQVKKRFSRQSGSCFYPVWHRDWGHGGTACVALTQLVRWLQGQPVLPLATWRYWCGDTVKLIKKQDPETILTLLERNGYPSEAACIFCGQKPRRWDWYLTGQLEGVGCYPGTGCKQRL